MNDSQLKFIRTLIAVNELREAIIRLKKVFASDPDNHQAFNLLGVVYEKRGDYNSARRMYRASLALNPEYEPARNNLSRLVRCPPDLADPDLGGPWLHNLKTSHRE
ncbi:MAG: tetratricopeptide repeat protein [Peptococcaceae bacterium]|nr:tetratricopeptide repeat protein [Peptococcaceae bacterium]